MMSRRPILFLALFGLLSACSRPVEPGLYLARTGEEEGYLRVGLDSLGREEAVFYRNGGKLWADTLRVGLDSVQFQLKPYEAPEFRVFPERTMYLAPQYKVGETRDVLYGRVMHGREGEYTDLAMDIYYPLDDRADARPLLMMFHGGAFDHGDKRDTSLVEWCRHFASLGYVVSSPNYRLGYRRIRRETDEAVFQALKDANASVRFLLRRDSLLIHPGRIFAAGLDAGAVTALNLAYVREENLPEIIQEEGDSIVVSRPELLRGFDVRAVANLWGAIPDTAILHNAKIPVISYQSKEDAVIPFLAGYPFEDEEDRERDLLREAWESILSLFLPDMHAFREMYGAGTVHRILRSLGVTSELHAFDGSRHDLLFREDGTFDFPLFDEIKEQTARFFSTKMLTNPVSLRQDPEDAQVFLINDIEVTECFWKVEGGVIVAKSFDTARVLLFPDTPVHSVSVSGTYTSGMTFNETVEL